MAVERADGLGAASPARAAFLSVLISALILLFIFPAEAFPSSGVFSGLSGTVYVKARGERKWKAAGRKTRVRPGDRVRTGSDGRATIRFEDSSTLSIGNDTEVEVTEYLLKEDKRSATYSVTTGKIRAFISDFSGETDFKVKTPTSTSGVKGTDFILMNKENANVIFGEEGSVAVAGEDGKTVAVSGGTMTENTKGLSPIDPVVVEPGSALEEARRDLEAVTDFSAPVEWERAGRLPDILARWNINYAGYLADSKRFDDSLAVFTIAIDLSTLSPIKAEAHLGRGTVYSRYLNMPKEALSEYMTVVDRYPEPPFAENALFSAGMINMVTGEREEAEKLFRRYIRDYPQGSHRDSIEFFLRDMEKE